MPRPRLLVSTPIHLRALLSANICLPTADLLVSATAPLPQDLAQKAEARFEAPLQEIYGSTETGLIATRRTAQTDAWTLLPGLHLTKEAEHLWVGGGHLAQKTEISDNLEVLNKEQFLLQGRAADLVNIAGKRSSLEYLNHQLNSIPEVQDGVFFMPEDGMPGSVSRLIAFVVARGVDAQLINTKLRERIDPAFLPRPLHMVDALPRNNTGKLPREALLALVTAYHKRGNNPDTA